MNMPTYLSKLSHLQIILNDLVRSGGGSNFYLSIGGIEVLHTQMSSTWAEGTVYYLMCSFLATRAGALGIFSEKYPDSARVYPNFIPFPTEGAAWVITTDGSVRTGSIKIYGA